MSVIQRETPRDGGKSDEIFASLVVTSILIFLGVAAYGIVRAAIAEPQGLLWFGGFGLLWFTVHKTIAFFYRRSMENSDG